MHACDIMVTLVSLFLMCMHAGARHCIHACMHALPEIDHACMHEDVVVAVGAAMHAYMHARWCSCQTPPPPTMHACKSSGGSMHACMLHTRAHMAIHACMACIHVHACMHAPSCMHAGEMHACMQEGAQACMHVMEGMHACGREERTTCMHACMSSSPSMHACMMMPSSTASCMH